MKPTEDTVLKGLRILVVDDDADSLDLQEFVLQSYGAEVIAVSSASTAMGVFTTQLINVLLCDISMPEEDGYSFIRQIRSLGVDAGGQVLAIAVSGSVTESDQKAAIAAGFQKHISKPIDPESLVKEIWSMAKLSEADAAAL